MKAKFIGCTLVVTPETEQEREQLKHYGSGSGLWECWGYEEDTDSFSVQGLCPVGLQDFEILEYLRFMLEMEEQPSIEEESDQAEIGKRIRASTELMDKVRAVLEAGEAS